MEYEKIKTDTLYVCYCLLKDAKSAKGDKERLCRMTETLYRAQEYYEKVGAITFGQAFVYGNGEVAARPLAEYERGFRAALDENVERYAISEALLLSYEILKDYMPEDEVFSSTDAIKETNEPEYTNELEDIYRLVIIGDYSLDTNSEAVDILIRKFNQLKKRCDFKICYLDTEGRNRSGNLRQMIDVEGLA